ncbi:MAG TPA: 50S ribosomal protein L10, partial [candidate division WOR-3 bacterium]|nr:50S ribosomal protein L10 [candidate division WOR-3 bacterium]
MPSQKNIAIREEIEEKIEKAKVIFVTDYKGLKVNEITELRKALRKNNVDLKVYKNRLFK